MSQFDDLFGSIAQQSKALEDAGNTRSYSAYIEGLIDQLKGGDAEVTSTVTSPTPNSDGEYVCLNEPLMFLKYFDKYSNSKDDCCRVFAGLLEERSKVVIKEIIRDDDTERAIWFNSTSKGINLRPGLENNETTKPTVVTFGKPDDSVHALVVGATGSGKSVFLHNLLFSMMTEYAPWELNLFLVDFKKVTLSKYLSNCNTPHVRAVAATSEVRYVVSLLQYINDCMRARQTFFSYLGLEKIDQLREEYQIVLPRVVLLIDEFQQMFTEATAREERIISEVLTSITKLGRATGFHLIFASQEMSGTLGANAFANFKVRFALRCDRDVSSRFLGNPAAGEIGERERGIVIENSQDGRVENNRTYKVPFIQDDGGFFNEYLESLTRYAERVSYHGVHKYYQEDFVRKYDELITILDNENVKDFKANCLKQNPSVYDILTLGDAVVFNSKRIDCETVFLEYGSKKNIGIFSPKLRDVIYVCKLLATNFKMSPSADKCSHSALIRNDLFERNYDIKADLGMKDGYVFYNDDRILNFLETVEYRKESLSLIQKYEDYDDLTDFARSSFLITSKYYLTEEVHKAFKTGEFEIEGLPDINKFSSYFEGVDVADIPNVILKMKELYPDVPRGLYEILESLYDVVVNGKEYKDLFRLKYYWVIGMDVMDNIPYRSASLIEEAPNYHVIFIFVGTSDARNFDLYDTCDYLFIAGNQERIYDRWGIPYTNKTEDSKVIDFKVRSAGIVRSFKKFFSEDDAVTDLPSLDFDELLAEGWNRFDFMLIR
ncbi:MAG: hypothetical protein IJ757_00880 [Clostridiales bacterium]|nr:hypothetical protein [Clostridiales bacterium]